MKKFQLIITLFLIISIFTSCVMNPDSKSTQTNISDFTSNATTSLDDTENYISNITLNYNLSTLNCFYEKRIDGVYPISNNLAYILYFGANQYHIGVFDIQKKSMRKATQITDTEAATVSCHLQKNNLCVEVRGMTLSGSDIKRVSPTFTVYDSSLSVLCELDLNKIVPFGVGAFDISRDFKKIVYQTYQNNQHYLCINNVDMTSPRYISVSDEADSIQSLIFINDSFIAFVGEKESEEILGVINLNSGSITTKFHKGISDNIIVSSEIGLFSDENTEPNKDSTGIVYIVNGMDGSIENISLVEVNESQNAILSNDGKLIITYLSYSDQKGDATYKYRVYNVQSGEMIKEFLYDTGVNLLESDIKNFYCIVEDDVIVVLYQIKGEPYIIHHSLF